MSKWFVKCFLIGSLLCPATLFAHHTGGEKRTIKACNALEKEKMRESCGKCVMRKKAHHFHPKRKAGKRCMRNGGKKKK